MDDLESRGGRFRKTRYAADGNNQQGVELSHQPGLRRKRIGRWPLIMGIAFGFLLYPTLTTMSWKLFGDSSGVSDGPNGFDDKFRIEKIVNARVREEDASGENGRGAKRRAVNVGCS